MPNSIIKSFAEKTGKSIAEVEKLWNEAKTSAEKQGHKEDYAYITGILKKMLNLNEDATTTADIAVVPKRLGEPVRRVDMEHDGILHGYPYFEIKEVNDFLRASNQKKMNQKVTVNDPRIHKHLKTTGNPFIIKHGQNMLKLNKKDIY